MLVCLISEESSLLFFLGKGEVHVHSSQKTKKENAQT